MAKTREGVEFKRLQGLFEPLPQNEKDLMEPVLQNFAFMTIKLQDLRARLSGSYSDEKIRKSDLADYNQTIKSYMSIYRELKTKLPQGTGNSKLSELLNE